MNMKSEYEIYIHFLSEHKLFLLLLYWKQFFGEEIGFSTSTPDRIGQ